MKNTNQTEPLPRTKFPPASTSAFFKQWDTFVKCSLILTRLRVREESDQIAVVGLDEAVRGFIKLLGDSYCDREDSRIEPDDLDEEIACRIALFKSLQESPPIVPTDEEADSDDYEDEIGYRTAMGECWGEVFELLHRYLIRMAQFFIQGYLSPITTIIHKFPTYVETSLAEADEASGWLSLEDYAEHRILMPKRDKPSNQSV